MDETKLTGDAPATDSIAPDATAAQQPLDAAEPQAAPEEEATSYDDLAPRRTSFTRQHTPRRTQEAIDDLAEDDNPISYAHESNVAVGSVIGDRSYRRARSDISQFQKNNRYGQYLEIPKGRRSIFAKRERARRRKSTIAAVVVVGLLAVAAYVVWQVMSRISFG